MNKTLKYISPAKSFTEALPLGNGSLGAMVYGGVPEEKISYTDDELDTPDKLKLNGESYIYVLYGTDSIALGSKVAAKVKKTIEEKGGKNR